MPPWIIFDDFEDVPDAKSPFSTRAVRRPRLAASSATPVPVTPPPTTSTSNSSSARRRNASARRKGCTGQDCHIRRGADRALSCHRGSRHGAAPSGGAGASRAVVGPRPASCRGTAPDRGPGATRSHPVPDDVLEDGPEVVDGGGAVPRPPRFLGGPQQTVVLLLRLLSLRSEAEHLAPPRGAVPFPHGAALTFQPSRAHGVGLP